MWGTFVRYHHPSIKCSRPFTTLIHSWTCQNPPVFLSDESERYTDARLKALRYCRRIKKWQPYRKFGNFDQTDRTLEELHVSIDNASKVAEERRRQRMQQLEERLKYVAERKSSLRGSLAASNAFSLKDSEKLSRYAASFSDVFYKCVLPALLGQGVKERRNIPEALDWLSTVVEHTSLKRRNDHPVGELLVASCDALAINGGDDYSGADLEKFEKICVAGWCAEMLHVASILQDEVVHRQVFDWRMESECWFRRKDVGLKAINDANLLKNSVFRVLRKHFSKDQHFYVFLVELFERCAFHGSVGQIQLDLMRITPLNQDPATIERLCTMDNFKEGVWRRETMGTLVFPVLCAMVLTNRQFSSPESHTNMKTVIRDLGWFRRRVTDYEDCFLIRQGESKPRYDAIKNGRCTWMVIHVIDKHGEEVKKKLIENYGHEDEERCKAVRDIFLECKLDEFHHEYIGPRALQIFESLGVHVPYDGIRDLLRQVLSGVISVNETKATNR